MRVKLRDWVETVGIGTIAMIFLFSTFATIGHVERVAADTKEYVNNKHDDVVDRIKDVQETVRRIEDRLNNRGK